MNHDADNSRGRVQHPEPNSELDRLDKTAGPVVIALVVVAISFIVWVVLYGVNQPANENGGGAGQATAAAPVNATSASQGQPNQQQPARGQQHQQANKQQPAQQQAQQQQPTPQQANQQQAPQQQQTQAQQQQPTQQQQAQPQQANKQQPAQQQPQQQQPTLQQANQQQAPQQQQTQTQQQQPTQQQAQPQPQQQQPTQRQATQPQGTQRGAQQEPGKPGVNAGERMAQNQGSNGGPVQLSQDQRTKIAAIIGKGHTVRATSNVGFSVSVGAIVPKNAHVEELPADIVAIAPQYEGFDYVVVGDKILLVDPNTMAIAAIIPA